MIGRWVRVDPTDDEWLIYRFPHRKVRSLMWSYARSYWRLRWCKGDPPYWPRWSWSALAEEWLRLLLRGYRDLRWD